MIANKMRLMVFCWICAMVSFSHEQTNQQCTPIDYPAFFDLTIVPPLIQLSFGPTGQALVGSYRFGCNGFITRLEAFCQLNGSHAAEFHVWRLNASVPGATLYNLVGKHVIQDARPDENNLLSLSVPEDQQIQVQPGDIVGLRGYNITEPNPFVIQAQFSLGADVTLYTLNENEPTPNVLNLNEVSPVPAAIGLPVIRITVKEISDQTTKAPTTTISTAETSQTVTTPSEPPNGGLTSQVIIAVSVTMGLLAITCVTIVISSCCIITHKRNQQGNNRVSVEGVPGTTSTFTQANVAYNRGNGTPHDNNNTDLTSYDYPHVAAGGSNTETQNSGIYDYII